MQEYRDMMTEIEKQGSLGPVLKQIETAVAGTCREIMEKGKNKNHRSHIPKNVKRTERPGKPVVIGRRFGSKTGV